MCSPMLLAFVCTLSQTSHAVTLPGLTRQGGFSDGQYLLGFFKLGNLQPFLVGVILGKFENVSGKSCFQLGELGTSL